MRRPPTSTLFPSTPLFRSVLDRAGVPGITDVWCPPVQTGINLLIRMKSSYRNQAKQAANAIWGSSAAHVRYKHITDRTSTRLNSSHLVISYAVFCLKQTIN